jgi:hypothetical protein
MTPEQIRDLALTLYAIILERDDAAKPRAVGDRCLRTCQARGLEPPVAALISEALTGYVYDGSRRGVALVTPISKAQAVLQLTMGRPDDAVLHPRPVGAQLTASAIAAMIGWVLTVGVEPSPYTQPSSA